MSLSKRYNPNTAEPRLFQSWLDSGAFHFDPASQSPVYSIDTPPPTVSGQLHLGHVYSYSHTDFIARFWRMRGHNVFYPMGFDDNGLPTERLVEKWEGVRAAEIGREAFIQRCLAVSEKAGQDYKALWQRLGLSIDWRYSYRTIGKLARRTAQLSFIKLYKQGLAYRRESPAIWCPECQTAIAQAELLDLERDSIFYTLAFGLNKREKLEIATTRPELLPACVAIFVHPDDDRFTQLVGQTARVPHFGQEVPILADPQADPAKGTGVVMCCTFGDSTDIAWWYTHNLPLRVAIDHAGCMTELAGEFAGQSLNQARRQIVQALSEQDLLLAQHGISQSVRAHERCDTPVEYVVSPQWFIRLLDAKERLLAAGEKVTWHPPHMYARYREWVQNLNWDWCISRQRYYGVTFPLWYCQSCGEALLADESELPVDPTERPPARACPCGSTDFAPEEDVMDTWATSALTPQIVGRWLDDPELYARVYPFSLRPQAHEIIRTWAFYTIVKSQYHFDAVPWRDAAISGWGIAPAGFGKISKSRGGGPMSPVDMIDLYSADAVRYWAASSGPGKDAIISEEKVQVGQRLVTKIWNVARFSQRFLAEYTPPAALPPFSPADRWLLARIQRLVQRATAFLEDYDYAAAKNETELFFWRDLADNYLEMVKLRLYGQQTEGGAGARYALYYALLTTLKLFAPVLPFVTEQIYQSMFAGREGAASIHRSRWPAPDPRFTDQAAEDLGETLIEIATAVRRFKSEHSMPLSTQIARLQLATSDDKLAELLRAAAPDISSVTRAERVEVVAALESGLERLQTEGTVKIAVSLG